MRYIIEVDFHKDERDWPGTYQMQHEVQDIFRRLGVDGIVVDVDIEEEDD